MLPGAGNQILLWYKLWTNSGNTPQHYSVRVKLYKNEGAPSGGLRKAALERKYGLGRVSGDPEPLINYLDVSQCCVCILHAQLLKHILVS